MKSLSEWSKQAKELYDQFIKEQEEIMEQIHSTNYRDTDEYDIPDDYDDIIDDCMYYGHTGHWDEQAYCDYMNAADEDGNWKHPYDIDI